jgi:hypothetical protein
VDPVALVKWAQAVAPDPDTTLDGKRPLNPRLPDSEMFLPDVKGTNVLGRTVAPTPAKKVPKPMAPKLPRRK